MTKLQKARKIKEKLENRLNTNKFESTTAKRLFNLNEKLFELEFEEYLKFKKRVEPVNKLEFNSKKLCLILTKNFTL